MSGKTKHGMSHSRIYMIYRDIKARCFNPNKRMYKHYGGRGITVCDEWLGKNGFSNFMEWAFNNGYGDTLEIDRIDVNGDYTPQNCRWSNKSTQCANKRSSGNCEYIGVYRRKDGQGFDAFVKHGNRLVFFFHSRSKNECAIARNEYIIAENLDYPLNIIDPNNDEIVPKKIVRVYAISKEDGSVVYGNIKDISEMVSLSKKYIHQCIAGKRNCKGFVFLKENDFAFD